MESGPPRGGITVKLFVGCLFSFDLKVALEKSREWKNSLLAQSLGKAPLLRDVRYEGREYLGAFLDEECVTIDLIEVMEAYILDTLSEYIDRSLCKKLKLYVFPQILVG